MLIAVYYGSSRTESLIWRQSKRRAKPGNQTPGGLTARHFQFSLESFLADVARARMTRSMSVIDDDANPLANLATKRSCESTKNHRQSSRTRSRRPAFGSFLTGIARLSVARRRVSRLRLRRRLIG